MIRIARNLSDHTIPTPTKPTNPTTHLTPLALRKAPRQPNIFRHPITSTAGAIPRHRDRHREHSPAPAHRPGGGEPPRGARQHRRRGVPEALHLRESRAAGAAEEGELLRERGGEGGGGEVEGDEPAREAAGRVVEVDLLHEVVYVADGEASGMREVQERDVSSFIHGACEAQPRVAGAVSGMLLQREGEADG